jgi:hypothetical protein
MRSALLAAIVALTTVCVSLALQAPVLAHVEGHVNMVRWMTHVTGPVPGSYPSRGVTVSFIREDGNALRGGNRFDAITDSDGHYALALPAGRYRVGFAAGAWAGPSHFLYADVGPHEAALLAGDRRVIDLAGWQLPQ